jgi:hypothetical protein
MVKLGFAVLAALVLWSARASAIDNDGAYFVRGVGNELCSTYTIARDNRRDVEFQAWLAGSISAFNRWTADVWDIEPSGDFTAALRWVDFYYSAHPAATFGNAIEGLMAYSYPNRLRNGRSAGVPGGFAGSSRQAR